MLVKINVKLRDKNILVTGGAGFIGSHLVEELLKYDCHIKVLDNLSVGKLDNIPLSLKIEFIKQDIRELRWYQKLFDGIDYVFHLAAITSVPFSNEHTLLTNEINMGGTFNVLLCAENTSVKKVINLSSAAIYGDCQDLPVKENVELHPISVYGGSKLLAEQLCEEMDDVKSVSLRLFNVYGKGQSKQSIIARFIKLAQQHKPLEIYGDGKATRDFVYVKDVVQALLLAAEKDITGVYNIGSGNETSVKELAELINKLIGNKAGIVYKPARDGDIKRSWADISKAKSIGYEPNYDLKTGLREMLGGK